MHFQNDKRKELLAADACLFVLHQEKKCIQRANRCNRKCENCDLVLPIDTVLFGYEEAIRIVEDYKKALKEA